MQNSTHLGHHNGPTHPDIPKAHEDADLKSVLRRLRVRHTFTQAYTGAPMDTAPEEEIEHEDKEG